MTPNEQRIAIAEHLGWTPQPGCKWVSGQTYGIPPNGENHHWQQFPDYPNDLNAMHEAEKRIPDEDFMEYVNRLEGLYLDLSENQSTAGSHCATASQRAEALLRTFKKWKD